MIPFDSPHNPLESVAVNNHRVVVGSAAVGDGSEFREAFRWTPETGLQLLGRLRDSDTESVAFDLTEDGKTIIGRSSVEQVFDLPEDLRNVDSVAFIWTESRGMMNLQDMLTGDYGLGTQLDGWRLKAARGITPDGKRIVGSGTNPEGFLEAFLVDLTLNTPAADTNFDGQVNLTDFDTLKDNFATGAYNAPAFRAQGNLNGDAVVDLSDFSILKAGFGPQVNPVPEPSACWLFAALFAFALPGWRRRRRSNS